VPGPCSRREPSGDTTAPMVFRTRKRGHWPRIPLARGSVPSTDAQKCSRLVALSQGGLPAVQGSAPLVTYGLLTHSEQSSAPIETVSQRRDGNLHGAIRPRVPSPPGAGSCRSHGLGRSFGGNPQGSNADVNLSFPRIPRAGRRARFITPVDRRRAWAARHRAGRTRPNVSNIAVSQAEEEQCARSS
jgi:hypothetical protein